MKRTLLWVFIALASGALLGKLTFDRYDNLNIKQVANLDEKVYMLKYGSYSSEDDMSNKLKDIDRYIYIEEDGNYSVYLAITKTLDNANKILNLYTLKNIKLEIEKLSIDNEEFISNLNEYEKLLSATEDEKSLLIIQRQILACYTSLVVEDE